MSRTSIVHQLRAVIEQWFLLLVVVERRALFEHHRGSVAPFGSAPFESPFVALGSRLHGRTGNTGTTRSGCRSARHDAGGVLFWSLQAACPQSRARLSLGLQARRAHPHWTYCGTAAGGGHRNWIGLEGGHFNATWGNGIVVPGGQDNQVVGADLSTHVDTHYLLKTDDGAHITVHTEGWRTVGTGGREALEKLFDPLAADTVSPADYKFRLYINLETGDERYKHLNASMWIGSGARLGRWVIYDAYRVL